MFELCAFIIGMVIGFWLHGQISKLYLRYLLKNYSQDDILHIVKTELPVPQEPGDAVMFNHEVNGGIHYFYVHSNQSEAFAFQARSLSEAGVTFSKMFPDRTGLFKHHQEQEYYRFTGGKYQKVSDTVYA